jgi:hypothetical protein
MQHITLRTNYLQQQTQQSKKLIIVVDLYSKSINTRNKKGAHLKKKVTHKIPKKKVACKAPKIIKKIINTMEQEQDEKVNQASMNNEDMFIHHAMCLKMKKT